MDQVVLEAQSRLPKGKGAARRERVAGRVPAVVYGHGLETQTLSVDEHTLATILRHQHGSNVLFDLRIDGKAPQGLAAIIKSLQTDPLTDHILAVDFQWVALTETVTVNVPIRLDGTAPGVVEGGVAEQMLHEVSVSCLPLKIPAEIWLDISDMAIGDTRHVSDIATPEGVQILADPESPVVVIRPPTVVTVAAAEEVVEAERVSEGVEEVAESEGEAESEDQE
ncbi:MAG: 50S ribosomal protein L25 [Candidatus Zipacnadales bacterium]